MSIHDIRYSKGRIVTGQGRETLHDRLLGTFKARILSRDWPTGFQLPFETDLAAAHGVSRMTMNKVLTQLTREGFLVRRRKLGTFVAAPRAQSAVMEIADIEAEVTALGLTYGFRLLSRDIRPPTQSECDEAGMDADRAGPVLALQGLHSAGGEPFCHEDRIINLTVAPQAVDQDFRQQGPGRWLMREIPWTAAEHRIRAVNPAPPVGRALGVQAGEACLEVARKTEAGENWVTLARQTYPGHRHQFVARFGPGGAAG